MAPEDLYGRLIELARNAPHLGARSNPPRAPEALQWLGNVTALVEEDGDIADLVSIRTSQDMLGSVTHDMYVTRIMTILYRVIARVEATLPLNAQGAFIPAGDKIIGFAAISRVLKLPVRTVLIVDPYMDETAVLDFSPLVNEGVLVRLLCDEQGLKPGLRPAVVRWQSQYGQTRPLEMRVSARRSLHDRVIIQDEEAAWILTQSLKDFGARSHATISKVQPEIAELKIPSYLDLWERAVIPT